MHIFDGKACHDESLRRIILTNEPVVGMMLCLTQQIQDMGGGGVSTSNWINRSENISH